MRGVALLAWRPAVGFQDGVDELNQRAQHRSLPLDRLALGWFGAGQRLPHHPPMHFKLRRYALDGPDPELVLPPDLLEQLHLRSPLHPGPPAIIGRMLRLEGGGPFFSIEVGRFTVSKSRTSHSLCEVALNSKNR